MDRLNSVLNSALEFGIRGVMVLHFSGSGMTARKVSLIDFIITHSGDFYRKSESVHASSPFRSGEWISRTSLFDEGLRLMTSYSLINMRATGEGFLFESNDLTEIFLNKIEAEYRHNYENTLVKISRYVVESDEQTLYRRLKKYVSEWRLGAVE